MWTWIWTLILAVILVLLLVAVFFSRITIKLCARKQNKDEFIHADVRALFGLVNIHYKVPKIKFENFKKGFKVESDGKTNVPGIPDKGTNEQQIGTEKIDHWKEAYHQLMGATKGLKSWMSAVTKHISIIKLDWLTDFSMKEADHTAVASGLLWSAKNVVVGGLSFHLKMENPPSLLVKPDFGAAPHFTTQIDCIAQIRLGYAMYAGLTLITRVLKVKGGTKQWLNILFKA